MAELAIFIKTLIKEKTIINCVKAIEANLRNVNYCIYIADDGPISSYKDTFYNELTEKGHKIFKLSNNIGASASRTALLAKLNEENFVLRMDDDFEISEETNLSGMINTLKKDRNIGAIADLERQIGHGKSVQSGRINPWQGFLLMKHGYLIKKMYPLRKYNFTTISNMQVAKSDFTRNMLLLKREIFQDICWDENLSFANEHVDFMLQLQKSKWGVVFTPNSVHLHRDDLTHTEAKDLIEAYHKFRSSNSSQASHYKYFLEKWNIKGVKTQRTPEIYWEKVRSLCYRH